MLGTALRLIALAQARRRLGTYVRMTARQYAVLASAGLIFVAAFVFAVLACFWLLAVYVAAPWVSALIMAAILTLAGLLTVLAAQNYGSARERSLAPPEAGQGLLAQTGEEIDAQLKQAVETYGPISAVALAAIAGLVLSIMVKRSTRT